MSASEELLEDRIASLRGELDSYGKDLIHMVQAIYGRHEQGPKFDLKNSPFQMIQLLKQEVTELIETAQEQGHYIEQYQEEIRHCKELADVLANISTIVDHMNSFEDQFTALKLIACCNILKQIEQGIAKLPGESSHLGAGKVCSELRNEKKLLRSRLISKIRRILAEAIQFDYGSVSVSKQISGYLRVEDRVLEEPLELSELLQAATSSGCIGDALDSILMDMWTYVLVPLWKERKVQAPNIHVSKERAEFQLGSVARGQGDWSHAEVEAKGYQGEGYWHLGVSKIPLSDLFDHIGHLMNFMWTEAFCANEAVSVVVGQKLNDEPFSISALLIETISNQMPKIESDLQLFKKSLDEPSKALEWKLDNFFKLSRGSTGLQKVSADFLTAYLQNMSSIFSSIRRKEILKHARELVLLDYHNTMIASGDAAEDELSSAGDIGDPRALLDQSGSFAIQKLKFDSCQISLAACRLLKFVHEVMQQATRASSDVANILFHSARDCLEIFIAIVPVKFAEIVDTIPRMGAVFYNDCLYIAHNTILLTHLYRNEMSTVDESLQGSIGFIDFIPRLRKLGDQCMLNHLTQQQALLKEMGDRIKITPDREQEEMPKASIAAKGLLSGGLQIAGKFLKVSANIDEAPSNSDINIADFDGENTANDESRAGILVGHLERLSTQWLGVLQDGAYARFMGLLIEDVVKALMQPLLTTECISETAGGEISRVFKIVQRTRSLLPSTDSTTAELNLKHICPSWTKFIALTDLLEYNLNDVADGLSRKKFVNFTSKEMAFLIKALFEDTPRRQTLLQSIAEMAN